ncbi:hypothetical protein SPONL_1063 [uncultured Candidatus Thioglobus sp.]|nr:hypothetical protein SPONL_1063 [uncultured Candidatus Thioglobus sp.]
MKTNTVVALVLLTPMLLLSFVALEPDIRQTDKQIQVRDCEISRAVCHFDLDGKTQIKINILPRGLPETELLRITLDTQGEQIDQADIIFEGIEIDTITPEYPLYKIMDTQFKGKGFLVVCSLSKMNWIAHLIINKNNTTWKVSFPFEKHYDRG